MKKGNILVIGNSGVGKSTLIKAVLGKEIETINYTTKGTTQHLEIYENDTVPFCIIDSVGFEPSFLKQQRAINLVKKWSKESLKTDNEEKQIDLIWFCVDGTSRKLFPDAIKNLTKATSLWKTVPVIVVITKSYSIPERKQNIDMVKQAFRHQKKYSKRLRKIIPVVAETYVLNQNAFAPPSGIDKLINVTNELLPEGIKASKHDIESFKLNRKRVLAHSFVATVTAAGTAVCVVPIPNIADSTLLVQLETAEINALASIYDIDKNEKSKMFINSIITAGSVSVAAKTVISALKTIPGINIAASALNAIIAGCIVAAIGEGSIYAFEQIHVGNKTLDDIEWVVEIIESKLTPELITKVKTVIEKINGNFKPKNIASAISSLFLQNQ